MSASRRSAIARSSRSARYSATASRTHSFLLRPLAFATASSRRSISSGKLYWQHPCLLGRGVYMAFAHSGNRVARVVVAAFGAGEARAAHVYSLDGAAAGGRDGCGAGGDLADAGAAQRDRHVGGGGSRCSPPCGRAARPPTCSAD